MAEENSVISSPTCDHDCDCSVHNKHRGKSEPANRNNMLLITSSLTTWNTSISP